MGEYVAGQLIRAMIGKDIDLRKARVLVLGLTFKENTPDLRNTRVVDIVAELESFGITVDVHDPWVDAAEAKHEYNIDVISDPANGAYDAIVLAVGHSNFRDLGARGVRAFGKPQAHVLYDLKSILDRDESDLRL